MGDIQRLHSPGMEEFVRKARLPEPHEPHPKTVEFFEHHFATTDDLAKLRDERRQLLATIDVQSRQIEYLKGELARKTVQSEAYQKSYVTLKGQLGLLGSALITALEASKQEVLREGVDPDPKSERTAEAEDAGLAAIGKAFGAGFEEPPSVAPA